MEQVKLLFRNNTNQDPQSKIYIIGGKLVEPPDRYPFYALLWTPPRANGSSIDWICGGGSLVGWSQEVRALLNSCCSNANAACWYNHKILGTMIHMTISIINFKIHGWYMFARFVLYIYLIHDEFIHCNFLCYLIATNHEWMNNSNIVPTAAHCVTEEEDDDSCLLTLQFQYPGAPLYVYVCIRCTIKKKRCNCFNFTINPIQFNSFKVTLQIWSYGQTTANNQTNAPNTIQFSQDKQTTTAAPRTHTPHSHR